MTRVLVVHNLYPPHSYGGYESMCAAAVATWRSHGHDVAVVCSDVRRPDVDTDGPDSSVDRVLPMYWHDHAIVHPSLRQRLANERRTRRTIESKLEQFRPDVVSVWNLAGMSFGLLDYVRRHHIPVVAVIADRWLSFGPDLDAWVRLFTRHGLLGRIAGSTVRTTTGLATAPRHKLEMTVLFASGYLADQTRRTSRFEFARTGIVPWGVDLDVFPLATDRGDRPWSGRLILVSRIDPRKGLGTAIRAVAELSDVTLDIAGAGDLEYRRTLERLADDLGVAQRVTFLGQRRPSDLVDLYVRSDAALFTSEWEEPFGIVPLEALACGVPLVATGTGGSGEFLHHEVNCLRYTPGNATALAEAVRRLASAPELRSELRANGFQTAEELSQTRCLNALEQWHVAAASGFNEDDPAPATDIR